MFLHIGHSSNSPETSTVNDKFLDEMRVKLCVKIGKSFKLIQPETDRNRQRRQPDLVSTGRDSVLPRI